VRKPAPADPVTEYAERVVAGDVLVNRLHRLACERHLRDQVEGAARGLRWDATRAAKAIAFFRKVLRHFRGEWAGKPFELAGWQQFIIGSLLGWIQSDDTRRFRESWWELPRKNGKSTLAAGLGLLLGFFDGEQAAEGYCAATKRDQAKIVWGDAREMVAQSPALKKRIDAYANVLCNSSSCKFEPLGADEDTMDGLSPHVVVIDEVHAHRTSGVVDVLKTATGARRQPLIAYTTTAGYDRQSVAWKLHEYAVQVLSGVIVDDAYYAFIACADEGDDWKSETTWRKANPNYGISVKPEKLRVDCAQAQQVPAWQNRFRRLHLNQWTEQASRAIDMDVWAAGAEPIDHARLMGKACWGGLDLAATSDLTAFVLLFGPDDAGFFDVLCRFWMPEERVRQRSQQASVRFDVWVEAGWITTTPGNVTDYDYVERDLLELADDHRIKGIAFDRWNASQLVAHLQDAFGSGSDATKMLDFGQGFASMSAPTKELLRLVSGRKLRHGGNPVLTWMISNLALRQDPAGNLKPDREKSAEKVDGVVALVMALGLAIRQPVEEQSPYEGPNARGFLTL
jgi:phage terminase large subunit-like protein